MDTAAISGPLPPEVLAQVLELVSAAASADGVAPLSEDVLLQVKHGSTPPARTILVHESRLPPDRRTVGYAHMDAPDYAGQGGDITAELVIHPAHRRQGYGAFLLASVLKMADGHGVRVWAHGDLPGSAALALSFRLTRIRALFQLRMPLAKVPETDPVFPEGVTVRTFVPGADEEAWLGVNHRAFAHHPEQGSWTIKDLRLREEEPWFDPHGFFLAERDGRIAGFHWTKVHQPDDGTAPIGEVYVVGVDPGQQGGGLGRALTLTGLAHLRGLGLADVMLYVDEDNTAAVRMYTGLGFGRWSADVMYRWDSGQSAGTLGRADSGKSLRSRGGRGAAATRTAEPQRDIELSLGKRPVAGGHGGKHVGVELDLAQRHIVVYSKIDLHGDRAHLLRGPAARRPGTTCSS